MQKKLLSEADEILMMRQNFTCENMLSKFFPFSTFNWCHHYTSVKTRVFLHKYSVLLINWSFYLSLHYRSIAQLTSV